MFFSHKNFGIDTGVAIPHPRPYQKEEGSWKHVRLFYEELDRVRLGCCCCWCELGREPTFGLNGWTGNDAAEKRRELTGGFHDRESTVEEMAGQCAVVYLDFRTGTGRSGRTGGLQLPSRCLDQTRFPHRNYLGPLRLLLERKKHLENNLTTEAMHFLLRNVSKTKMSSSDFPVGGCFFRKNSSSCLALTRSIFPYRERGWFLYWIRRLLGNRKNFTMKEFQMLILE